MASMNTYRFDQFGPKNNPNSISPQYLIVGFDTEYQRDVFTNAEGKVERRNKVLSYQYSCRVVTPDNEGSETEWSGIILPKGRQEVDRLALSEFVEHALAAGFRSHPKLVVPVDVYLVAHFTRADVPGFSDFKDDALRAALNLDNIRGLFMNVSKDITVKLDRHLRPKPIELNVKIRDTIALAPAGAKSLARLGEILGFDKMKLSDDPAKELYFKQNMAEFMEADWRLFRDYAIRDAEICTQYTTRIIRLYFEKTGKFKLPVTLTSIGVDLIQKFWTSNGVDPIEIVGKETIVEKYWSKKYSRFQTSKKTVSIKKLFWNEDFFTECYHGGRNEQFWFGPAPKGIWYDYDLSSAYPSAMALIGRADWSTIRAIKDTKELLVLPTSLTSLSVFEFKPRNILYIRHGWSVRSNKIARGFQHLAN